MRDAQTLYFSPRSCCEQMNPRPQRLTTQFQFLFRKISHSVGSWDPVPLFSILVPKGKASAPAWDTLTCGRGKNPGMGLEAAAQGGTCHCQPDATKQGPRRHTQGGAVTCSLGAVNTCSIDIKELLATIKNFLMKFKHHG